MPRHRAHPDERRRWLTPVANYRGVIAAIHHMGIEPRQITALGAWQSGAAERFANTARYDLPNHVIAPNEGRLQRLLACFASYYLNDRTRLSLKRDSPAVRAVESKLDAAVEVNALRGLGGLHRRGDWRRAA